MERDGSEGGWGVTDPRVFPYWCECKPGCQVRIVLRHGEYLDRSLAGPVVSRSCAFRRTLSDGGLPAGARSPSLNAHTSPGNERSVA